jgi:hypothetical protein
VDIVRNVSLLAQNTVLIRGLVLAVFTAEYCNHVLVTLPARGLN